MNLTPKKINGLPEGFTGWYYSKKKPRKPSFHIIFPIRRNVIHIGKGKELVFSTQEPQLDFEVKL